MLTLCSKLFLNCLFYLLQFLALFFPVEFEDLTLYDDNFWILRQIYAVFVSFLLVFSYVYLQWLEVRTIYQVIRTSNIILSALTHTCFTIICLVSILGTAFWNKDRLTHYLKLQKILKSKMKAKLTRGSFYFCSEFVLGHVVLLAMAGIDIWRIYEVNICRLNQILSIALKQVLFYYCFLITIIIYNGILLLKSNFRTLRIFLTSTVGLEGNNEDQFTLYKPAQDGAFPIAVIGSKTLFELTEASKILNILFECTDIFNQVFGLDLVFINVATVLTILSALNTLLVSGETNQLTIHLILNCLSEALTLLVWTSFILSASGLFKEESSQIVMVCCKLQHLLPQTSQERKELLNIAHQVRRKSPGVSASGFFDIDFYLIIAIFTYVGTYTVVLIQFSHMDF